MMFPAVQEFQPILSKSEGRGALPDLVLDLGAGNGAGGVSDSASNSLASK
jgi:hypothetical protein